MGQKNKIYTTLHHQNNTQMNEMITRIKQKHRNKVTNNICNQRRTVGKSKNRVLK